MRLALLPASPRRRATAALPAVMVEREATDGAALDLEIAVAVAMRTCDGAMPSRSATRRG